MCGIQGQILFFFVKQLFSEYILPFKEIPFVKVSFDTIMTKNKTLLKRRTNTSMKMITK